MQMPRGDDPEDSLGIQSWEVSAKTRAGVHMARQALSTECENDEAIAEGRTGACPMVSDAGEAELAQPQKSLSSSAEAGHSQKRRWCLPNFSPNIISCLRRMQRGRLSPDASALVEELFRTIDCDGSGEVTRSEALRYFGDGFGKMSANAMFCEVDTDKSQAITVAEFRSFWEQVKTSGYSDDEIIEELAEMLEGGHWVDFDDKRKSLKTAQSFSTKHMQQQPKERAAPERRRCCLPRFANISERS